MISHADYPSEKDTVPMLISFVVPCYNEEESLPLFYDEACRVANVLRQQSHAEAEFIFVDDGSGDKTLEKLRALHAKDERVHYISFSRNFGKEAGFFAKMFYRIINKMSGTEIVDGARDFRFMTRKFVDAVLSLSEYNRFSKGIFSWVGFKTHWISYENIERAAGKTKWNFWSLFKYSIEGIAGFSTVPLALSSFLGVFCCLIAFIGIIVVVVRALLFGDPVAGWPSMISIMLLIGGLQLFCIGIVGEYLSKTYTEVKHRPLYLTKETDGEDRRFTPSANA